MERRRQLNLFTSYAGATQVYDLQTKNGEYKRDAFLAQKDDFLRRSLDVITIVCHHIVLHCVCHETPFPLHSRGKKSAKTKEQFKNHESSSDFAKLLEFTVEKVPRTSSDPEGKEMKDLADHIRRNIRNRLAHGGFLQTNDEEQDFTEMFKQIKDLLRLLENSFVDEPDIQIFITRGLVMLTTTVDYPRLQQIDETCKAIDKLDDGDKKYLAEKVLNYLRRTFDYNLRLESKETEQKLYGFINSVISPRIILDYTPTSIRSSYCYTEELDDLEF